MAKSLLFTTLRSAKGRHWGSASKWIWWNIVFGMLPLWATALAVGMFGQDPPVKLFAEQGDLALYAASYVGAAWYFVVNDFRPTRFPNQMIFNTIFVILLVTSLMVFATVKVTALIAQIGGGTELLKMLQVDRVRAISYGLLPLSLLIGYFINVVDNAIGDTNIMAEADETRKTLDKAFDQLGDL